jgi:hypothetical protein
MSTKFAGFVLLAALAVGCAGAPERTVADPVMAGKRYVDTPMSLGAVKMLLKVYDGAAGSGADSGPQNLELSLGFLARNETAKVIVSSATIGYGGKTGELVTRHESLGSAQGCGSDRAAVLPEDYWFNAAVTDQLWSCVTLAIVTPGRMASDALELRMEPINVNGELVRVLPVTFVKRPPE